MTRGVSANLCDAVVGLSAVSLEEGLDVQVSWSRTRPVDGAIPSRVIFGSDSIPLMDEAARQFREAASWDDVEVEGVVTRLVRETSATEGDVTITGSVDGQMRRITLRLDPNTYSQTVQAHDERRTVRCTGELVKEAGGYRLKDPRHFEILGGD